MGRLYHNLYFVGIILKLKIERWNLLILLKYFSSIQGLLVNFLTYWLFKSFFRTKYSWVSQCFKERRSAFRMLGPKTHLKTLTYPGIL